MDTEHITLKVDGMTCGHCARAVKKLAEEVKGVKLADVDLATKNVSIELSDPSLPIQAIIDNINSSNVYKATLQ